jgi:hypothetical protein
MRKNFEIYIAALFMGVLLAGCSNSVFPISIPQPTTTAAAADSKFCQEKMQVSAPIVVRPEGVGGTDSTEYGYWAREARAVSTSAGILATWQTGFDGQYPVPNVYMRFLDDNANPAGEISLLSERSAVQTPSFISKGDGALFMFCALYDHRTYLTSALLDPYGKLISEQRRFSTTYCGGVSDPEAIWTGSRLLFAWYPQMYGPDVLFEVADTNGNSLLEKKFRTDGASDPHFAYGHGRVLMVVPLRTGADFMSGIEGQSYLAVHRFDIEGNEIAEPVNLEPIPGSAFGTGFIVPTEAGWLIIASTSARAPGYYVARLAPDGSLVSGPDLVNTDIGFQDVIPYGGGAVALAGKIVLFFEADGSLRQEWSSDEYMDVGGLVVHKGRLFILYATQLQGKPETNQVLIREFQCVP